ncbi:MAG: chromosomal replication initiator protein DnaA [Solitalea-like symbiont of Acarus siro]
MPTISNVSITPSKNIEIESLQEVNIDSNLNNKYSFDNFIEGTCNKLARSAGLAVAEKPGGTSFNPLFIYGQSGLGKTHLSHAIGINAKTLNPNLKVLYVPAEIFGQQFVRALYSSKINDFTNFYQQFDLLIVDDIQFFSGKTKIQNTFFSVFNYLHTSGKQIILTCDQAPKDLAGLEDRLLSRFKWGLSARLDSPAIDTRVNILKIKLKTEGIDLQDNIIEYVANNVKGNVRELEGIIISLIAHATFNSVEIDLNLVKEVISSTIKEEATVDISLDHIQGLVCDYFSVAIDQLKSKTRRREIVQARQISMYLAKKHTKLSLKRIGQFYGGKDHSTVIYACNTISDLVSADKNIRNLVL